jgi:hypothetical protein
MTIVTAVRSDVPIAHSLANEFAAVEGCAILLRDRWDDMTPAQRAEMYDVVISGTRHLSEVLVAFVECLCPAETACLRSSRDANPFG